MKARLPLILIAGLTLLSPGRAQAQPTGPAPGSVVISDRAGDTVDDDSGAPLQAPHGDLVVTGLEYTADQVRLAARVAQPVDPATDAGWSGDGTFLQWELDTTGDARPDYVAQFAVENGSVYGVVTRPDDPDSAPPVCDASVAHYTASSTYLLGVPPSCLGSPPVMSYRATMYYDTDPGDDSAPIATDVSPDNGFAGPVGRASQPSPGTPAGAPGAPSRGGGGPSAGGPPSTSSPSPASGTTAPMSPGPPAAATTTDPGLFSPTPPPRPGSPATTARPSSTTAVRSPDGRAPSTASTGRPPATAATSPSATGSHVDIAAPPMAPAVAGGAVDDGRGAVVVIAAIAVALAWTGQVVVLAHRRRLRTALA
jgi:hypothetical protein